ncbi:DUF6059 family protein [Streptomyces sp. NPDC050421]|uniref:DUF6059 family protein n=1 Tax=unclassified Streptomyces TaxID=2593676 RepID=UPI003798B9F1
MPYAKWWKRRAALERALGGIGDALVALGAIHLHGEAQEVLARRLAGRNARKLPGRYLHEPPPGHPERLRPDVPLSPLELELGRQLMAAYHHEREEEGRSGAV